MGSTGTASSLASPQPTASVTSVAAMVAAELEELDFGEIQLMDIVGQGTFGTVKRALWREKIVAVKIIVDEMARKSFFVEKFQLSRIKHDNIITLYGACTKNGPTCLVMEYAECGSLHKILHCLPRLMYKASHAMSWMLQCAEGVEYLHSFKPKALVHRDLKPLNLLLMDLGRKLKICDFGTACNLQTNMTNNKGSAQWMAPEVFEGCKYSEKCDVFSWGIMLWEVLTRRKPFAEVGGTAYSVMWAVHSGQRPPLIQNCPKPIEILITRSWGKSPTERPSMNEIVKIMSYLMRFFKGADEPLEFESNLEMDEESDSYSMTDMTLAKLVDATPLPGVSKPDPNAGVTPIVTLPAIPPYIKGIDRSSSVQQSAPASLAGSEEELLAAMERAKFGGIPGDTSKEVKGHRRTGSDSTANIRPSVKPIVTSVSIQNADGSEGAKTESDDGFRLSLPSIASGIDDSATGGTPDRLAPAIETPANGSVMYLALDAQFQPLRPFPGNQESMQIFLEHCQEADEYIKDQEEIRLLLKRKQDLITELQNNLKEAHQTSRYQEYQQLRLEQEQMQDLHKTLKADLEAVRKQRKP